MRVCETCGAKYKEEQFDLPFKFFPDEKKTIILNVPSCNCFDKEKKEKEKEKRIAKLIYESNMPKIFRDDNFEDWVKLESIKEMTNLSKIYLKNYRINYDKGIGIFLIGNVGTGKTRLQCCMLKKMIEKIHDANIYFLSSDQFSRKLDELYNSRSELLKYMELLTSKKILLFDDFGESPIPEWRVEYLTSLINDRYYNKKVTWFNTMKSIEELNVKIGSHIISRILEMCRGYICVNKSNIDMRKESNVKKYMAKNN